MSIFEKEDEAHESYGLVSFSRITGSFRNLFGTNVDSSNAIKLRIKKCSVNHHLGSDWHRDDGDLIEVTLSPNQFSELLTTMNQGSGVPCTINNIAGKRIDIPPKRESTPEKVRFEFQDQVNEIKTEMSDQKSRLDAILNKKSISKSDREDIRKIIERNHMQVTSNLPFYLKQFNKATNKIVDEAKSVVDSFVTSVIAKAGIKSIKDNNGIVDVPKLESKDGE